jgi:hypothetical protein
LTVFARRRARTKGWVDHRLDDAPHGSITAEHVGSDALATHTTDARRPTAFITDPIRPSESTHDNSRPSGSEYGWGPFRTIDW